MISRQRGFTIIEVVLFLAITGIMIAGILATTGSGLNMQRYRDSVDSLQSYIQNQYSEALAVRNDISTKITCTAGTVTIAAGTPNRGQSACVLMGRYITSANAGKSISVYPVVGYRAGTSTFSDDYAAITSYTLTKIDSLVDNYNLEWGASMTNINKTPSNFTILIARSPVSGSILTFIDASTANSTLVSTSNLLKNTALSQNLVACLNVTSGISISGKMGIRVNANSSSGSGVEMLGDAAGVCV